MEEWYLLPLTDTRVMEGAGLEHSSQCSYPSLTLVRRVLREGSVGKGGGGGLEGSGELTRREGGGERGEIKMVMDYSCVSGLLFGKRSGSIRL